MNIGKSIMDLCKKILSGNLLTKDDKFLFYLMGTEALPSPLSNEEEERLVLEMEEEGKKEFAKEKLIEHNLRLVVYIAKKFESPNISVEDLISVGSIGLIKAINSFNKDKNIKVATYASRCIQNEILMYLRKNSKTQTNISLNEPIKNDSDGNELVISDLITDEKDNVVEKIENNFEKEILLKLLESMPEREKEIISLRFGLYNLKEMTQKEIANELNISQSYISRIEKKVINKLKKDLQKYA